MGLGGRGFGGNSYLANKVVREEATGKNCGVFCREANLKNMYRRE